MYNTLRQTDICDKAIENGPWMKMYFLLDMGI